jgi:hypothetical protein
MKSVPETPLLPEEGWQPLRLAGWWESDRLASVSSLDFLVIGA